MSNRINKTLMAVVGLLATGAVQAHHGAHGSEDFLAGVVHLLGEHGYIVLLLAIVGAALISRSDRA